MHQDFDRFFLRAHALNRIARHGPDYGSQDAHNDIFTPPAHAGAGNAADHAARRCARARLTAIDRYRANAQYSGIYHFGHALGITPLDDIRAAGGTAPQQNKQTHGQQNFHSLPLALKSI